MYSAQIEIEAVDIPVDETMGERVRRLRLAMNDGRGWTIQQLADAAGVSKQQVQLVENGTTKRLHPLTRRMYAMALGVSEDYLVNGVEPPPAGLTEWPDIETYARGRGELTDEESLRFLRKMYEHLVEINHQEEDGSTG